MQNDANVDVDVVVIGGGPVGATALALLGRRGLTAIGIEREEEVWPGARAVHFDGEALRTLQSLGIADRFIETTLPMASMHIENEDGEVLVAIPTGALGSQGWHDDVNFHQPEVEHLIRGVIDALPSVELRSGVRVTRVDNVDGRVDVHTISGSGREETISARWVIAADGARSEVRQGLGIATQHFGEDAQWLVVDGHLEGSPGLEDDMIFLARHSRPALWVRLPGTRVRMEFMLVEGDDPEEIVTTAAVERLSRGVLPAAHFTAERQAIYTFRGRVADTWRVGGIFLAGDAAHQAPPLYGQGLCAGIRDAANLVWKLDLVKRGVADEALLDTYESERRPHARFWVDEAAKAATIVQTTDPDVARQRDAFLRSNPQAAAPTIPALGPGAHSGDQDERAGRLSVQPIREDGIRLDDIVGPRFLVAATDAILSQLDPAVLAQLTESRDVVVMSESDGVGPALAGVESGAVVMRPDHYIAGVADSASDLETIIRTIPVFARPLATTVAPGEHPTQEESSW